MSEVLPRAGAILAAEQEYEGLDVLSPFIRDEHDDYWSIVAGLGGESCPVQKHTSDGWVAAMFFREFGQLSVVAPGYGFTARNGRVLIAVVPDSRRGVRWQFAGPSS